MPMIRAIGLRGIESWIPLRLPRPNRGSWRLPRQYSFEVRRCLAVFWGYPTHNICVDFAGWQLGSDPEIQVATVISNHLTAGIMKYFGDSYRLQHAANLFEKLVDKEPEVAALLAKSYIGMSEYERARGWSTKFR